MQLTADTGLMMAAYTAEPGSSSEQALSLLASCAATPATSKRRTRPITPEQAGVATRSGRSATRGSRSRAVRQARTTMMLVPRLVSS